MTASRERAYIEPRVRGQAFTYGQFDASTGQRAAVEADVQREADGRGSTPLTLPGEGGSKVQDIARQGPAPPSQTQRRKF